MAKMDRKQFREYIVNFYASGVEMIDKKNADYASNESPFANFYNAEHLGIADAKTALMVRLCDKFTRIGNGLKRDLKVKDESIQDTLLDAANYIAILSAMITDEKTPSSPGA